ncbi:MAG: FAD binding domain-containing protein [Deltaproteobacteria bacterium]|nr:FAD binding domain-containing protein [Deltaproteobacteria bacterium]
MRLPKFEYFEPRDLKEALSLLRDEPSAKILAGGTDLLVNMKHRVECPQTIVNIKRIEGLDRIEQDHRGVRIGALTTLKRLYSTPLIAEKLPGLAEAAAAVGSYHHQVMGTVAGNLCQQNRCKFYNQSKQWRSSRPTCYKAGGEICHVLNKKEVCYSSYCGDLAPVLLVLNARLVLTGPEDRREMALEAFYSGDGKAPLGFNPGEILTEIIVPKDAAEGGSCYTKFANRESIDFPIVGAASWASAERKECRVAFTAVDRKPLRANQVEAFLNGKDLTEQTVNEAAGLASKAAGPVKTSVYSPSFKRRMMGLLLQDTVGQAVRRSHS